MFYVVLLGGEHPRAKLELHDIVFLFADRIEDAYDRLRAAWFAAPGKVHIDGWMELDGLDGYRIESADAPAVPGEPRLYCAQLGGYTESVFGEAHPLHLVVAPDAATAKRQTRQASGGNILIFVSRAASIAPPSSAANIDRWFKHAPSHASLGTLH
jgi:hypothetical protein